MISLGVRGAVGFVKDAPVHAPHTLDTSRTTRNNVCMGQIRYKIPDTLHRALKARAAQEGVTIRELLIRLLSEALGVEEEE